jgi:glucose-1-phosphate cytidylyltransferase
VKVIILAGGLGTRISEETKLKPKPMVLLDDKPILWHVMNIYARQGFDEFIIAIGHKGEIIKDWIDNLDSLWNISAVHTGLETQTGGRIRQVMNTFNEDQFMVTYGDGVGNIDIKQLIAFHNSHGRLATVTAVSPPARFGVLQTTNGLVENFGEKSQADAGWINGGFFVLNREIISEIHDDLEPFESHVLPRLVAKKQLMAYHHKGFWKPMDTLREKNELSEMAFSGSAPWLDDLENNLNNK